jgi:hypothetical protein
MTSIDSDTDKNTSQEKHTEAEDNGSILDTLMGSLIWAQRLKRVFNIDKVN